MKDLYAALAKAQGEFPNIELNASVTVKTVTGSTYKFDYATLGQIIKTIRPILAKYELSYIQTVEAGAYMMTKIMHSSGGVLESKLPLPELTIVHIDKQTGAIKTRSMSAQERGSVFTYFRRYGVVAAFGLVAEDDDDANIAEGNEVKKEFKSPLFQSVSKSGKPYNAYRDKDGLVFLDDNTYQILTDKLAKGLSITEDIEIIKRKQSNQ